MGIGRWALAGREDAYEQCGMSRGTASFSLPSKEQVDLKRTFQTRAQPQAPSAAFSHA
jgi:hypothetical protein